MCVWGGGIRNKVYLGEIEHMVQFFEQIHVFSIDEIAT